MREHIWPVGDEGRGRQRRGENMEQMFHNLNLRTGPPRRALLEEKSRMASQGFCFPCTSKP